MDGAQAEFGRVDIMGNIAGIPHNKMVMDVTDEDFERILSINLKSCFYGCQAAMRVMAPRESGNIINISSGAIDTPAPTLACYGMTKAAVAMLTKTLACEAGPLGIRVNALAPGVIHTNFSRHNFVDEDGNVIPEKVESYKKRFGAMAPLKRVGEAQDVADSILFLVSECRVVHDRPDPAPQRRRRHALVEAPWMPGLSPRGRDIPRASGDSLVTASQFPLAGQPHAVRTDRAQRGDRGRRVAGGRPS